MRIDFDFGAALRAADLGFSVDQDRFARESARFADLMDEVRSPRADGSEDVDSTAQETGDAELWEAARSFEAFFLEMLIKGMRRTVPEGGLFQSGFARDVYQEMQDHSTAEEMSRAGGIGLARLIVDAIS